MPRHPIFDDISSGDLAGVQQRVRADPAVVDEQYNSTTPLMRAIAGGKTAITLYLIEHRGAHDLDTGDFEQWTALHWACSCGQLAVVQALVAAGASAVALTNGDSTPLIFAAHYRHPDIVASLLSLPSVRVSVDALDDDEDTALSCASTDGHLPTVQLLIDAGANPTIPDGPKAPLNQAVTYGHHAIAALLRQAIDHRRVALPLLKARTVMDAALHIRHARDAALPTTNDDEQHRRPPVRRVRTRGDATRRALAVAPACLQGRIARNQPLPTVAINDGDENEDNEETAATLRFVLGLQGHGGWAGAEDERATMRTEGLFPEVFVELLEYLLPAALARAGLGGMQ